MTLITQSTKAVAQGNGATVTWPFTFLIPASDDLTVTLVDVASGNPTVLAPSVYTVTGFGDPLGGVVTYPLSGSPLTSATYIVVERFVPEVQETDLTNQGAVYPADIEDALDYLTMITQQLQDQVDRSIVFSVADTVTVPLPTATARADLFLGFNSSGDPVAVDGLTAGTTVSAAMIPVVTAPTTAAALTALGLPGSLLDLLIPSGTCWEYDAAGAAPTGFVFPIGQACTPTYPDYRAKLVAAGSPYGTNGTDPLMPDRRSTVGAGKSNMGGVDNGLLTGGTVLGAVLSSQNINLAPGNIPDITGDNNAPFGISGTSGANLFLQGGVSDNFTSAPGSGQFDNLTKVQVSVSGTVAIHVVSFKSTNTSGSSSGTAFSRVQPTFICNFILKVH